MLEKILQAAKQRGITQQILEQSAALARNRISKWKADQGEPSWHEVVRLARVVDLPLDYLADDSADTAPAREPEDPDWLTLRRMAAAIGPSEAIRRILNPPLDFEIARLEPPSKPPTGAGEQPHDHKRVGGRVK